MTQEILVNPTTSGLYTEQCNRKKQNPRFLLKLSASVLSMPTGLDPRIDSLEARMEPRPVNPDLFNLTTAELSIQCRTMGLTRWLDEKRGEKVAPPRGFFVDPGIRTI
jgi:hypothetical protein